MGESTPGNGTFGESPAGKGDTSGLHGRMQTYDTFGESSTGSDGDVASQTPGSVDHAVGPVQGKGQQSANHAKQAASEAT